MLMLQAESVATSLSTSQQADAEAVLASYSKSSDTDIICSPHTTSITAYTGVLIFKAKAGLDKTQLQVYKSTTKSFKREQEGKILTKKKLQNK